MNEDFSSDFADAALSGNPSALFGVLGVLPGSWMTVENRGYELDAVPTVGILSYAGLAAGRSAVTITFYSDEGVRVLSQTVFTSTPPLPLVPAEQVFNIFGFRVTVKVLAGPSPNVFPEEIPEEEPADFSLSPTLNINIVSTPRGWASMVPGLTAAIPNVTNVPNPFSPIDPLTGLPAVPLETTDFGRGSVTSSTPGASPGPSTDAPSSTSVEAP